MYSMSGKEGLWTTSSLLLVEAHRRPYPAMRSRRLLSISQSRVSPVHAIISNTRVDYGLISIVEIEASLDMGRIVDNSGLIQISSFIRHP